MAAWPVSLPQSPLAEGWGEKFSDNLYRFQPRQGQEISRVSHTQDLDTQDVSFKLTAVQRATLETFYKTTLARGSLSFTWTHPASGIVYDFKIVGQIQFRSPDAGTSYIVNFQLMRTS